MAQQSCRTCRHLDVPPRKDGKRIARVDIAYRCLAPIPRPAWPDSVTKAYGFNWPDDPNARFSGRVYVQPDQGAECPTWEPKE